MSNIWITSDTHFNHSNIIKYCNRPFHSVREMDEILIENWNKVVKPTDKVYHLGDVYMKASKGYIESILQRLNGRKRLILGNHDVGKDQILQRYFEKISVWRDFKDHGVLLTHIPLHKDSIIRERINVHGHIHQRHVLTSTGSKDKNYFCACVEHTNYTPINIEEIRRK